MLIAVLVVGGPVAVVFAARRLAGHPLVVLVRDVAVSVVLVARFAYRGGRLVVRVVAGEVRSW